MLICLEIIIIFGNNPYYFLSLNRPDLFYFPKPVGYLHKLVG